MNYKLKKFWNKIGGIAAIISFGMNYKLKKFWNVSFISSPPIFVGMNYKLKKFWNAFKSDKDIFISTWTINLKSFEI